MFLDIAVPSVQTSPTDRRLFIQILLWEEFSHTAITARRHCYNKEKENSWPHPPTAERERPAHTAMNWVPEDGRRKRGRPKKTWRSINIEELEEMCVSWHGAHRIATGRDK